MCRFAHKEVNLHVDLLFDNSCEKICNVVGFYFIYAGLRPFYPCGGPTGPIQGPFTGGKAPRPRAVLVVCPGTQRNLYFNLYFNINYWGLCPQAPLI